MNKKEFLLALKKELKGLPENEMKEVMNYYNEYLNELNVSEIEDIDTKVALVKDIAEEVYNQNAKTLQIRVEEIEYTMKEIEEVEKEVLFPKTTILQEYLGLEKTQKVRKEAFEKIKSDVENKLYEDEEIILKTIIVPDPKRAVMVYRTVYNRVIFITNERIFIYSLDLNYKELEKKYVASMENIDSVEFNDYNGDIYLCFNDGKRFRLKAYRKADKRLMFIMLKYLSENEVVFKTVKYN